MSAGRVHVVLVATKLGHVIYERFFEGCDAVTRSEIRGAFNNASQPILETAKDGEPYVGNYRFEPMLTARDVKLSTSKSEDILLVWGISDSLRE